LNSGDQPTTTFHSPPVSNEKLSQQGPTVPWFPLLPTTHE
jgi:hypothetical protein